MRRLLNYFILVLCIVSTFLLTVNSVTMVNAAEVYPYKGAILAPTLVVHNKANFNASSSVTEIAYGTVVDVLELATSSMIKIKYDGDKEGYVSKNYVVNLETTTLTESVEGIETYGDYCNSLVSKGFNKSYCPHLYYLHSKHPKWIFTPDVINETLESAADSQEGNGVLDTANENYWLSNKVIEKYYHEVKASLILSIMDPRNSLYENTIFQFLDLEDSSDIYNDKVLAKVADGGNLTNFYPEFKEAATKNKVNVVHLMARSKQEGANKVGYSATKGSYSTDHNLFSHQGYSLDGYYNFYNIGSYKDESAGYTDTIQRGLAHAAGYFANNSCFVVDETDPTKAVYDATRTKNDGKTLCGELSYQRPWNTPSKAVSGGAEFIAGDYIRIGQDTMHYQKFNVSSYTQTKRHTHQYMTNLGAPWSEADMLYYAYKAGGLLDEAFNFVIPVYTNMPDTVYQPVNKSSNNRLSNITINEKNFELFDADVVEYTYNLVTSEDTFKIGAKTEDSLATVTGTGDYTFVDGKAEVKIVVQAEDGSTNTYVLNIKKVIPEEVVTVNDVVSKMGIKANENIMYGISPDTAITTLVNTVTKNKGEAKITDSAGKVKSSGSFVTGDKITIIGTSEEKTFTIAVRGDISGDGIIKINDLILVQSHILEKNTLKDVMMYAADVNFDGVIKINDLILVQSHILEKNKL